MKLLCLHGFLGSSHDFSFLEKDFEIIAPNLDDYVGLGIREIKSEIEKLSGNESVHLLGYSFGARLGMRLFSENPGYYKSANFLGGHLGLRTQVEKEERLIFENQMIQKLEELSLDEFLNQWNSYDIFKGDAPVENLGQSKQIAKTYFKRWGLSKQSYYYDSLLNYKDKVMFHYGELDSKYCDYAKLELNDFSVRFHKNVGHRILKRHDLVFKILEGLK